MCEACIARTGGAARMGTTKARRSIAAASRAGQAGRMRISLTFLMSTVIVILVLFAVVVSGSVFETIASACNRDNLGVV